jgi:hypothetical protein
MSKGGCLSFFGAEWVIFRGVQVHQPHPWVDDSLWESECCKKINKNPKTFHSILMVSLT